MQFKDILRSLQFDPEELVNGRAVVRYPPYVPSDQHYVRVPVYTEYTAASTRRREWYKRTKGDGNPGKLQMKCK